MNTKWWTALAVAAVVLPVQTASAAASPAGGPSPAAVTTPPPGHGQARPVDRIREQLLRHDREAGLLIVSHRGDWRGSAENSLPAVEGAVKLGADIVEIDVQRTKDGQLVLMHDTTVDRTTDGTGKVADLTLDQIKALKLRIGLGGAQARTTDLRVPTLEEALAAVKGKALVNLDKAWQYRDEAYAVLTRLGMLDHALFKSSAPVAEVEQFLAKDPGIRYAHVVDDANADSVGAFAQHPPLAYEINFDRLTDPQIQPAAVATALRTSRVWANTMTYGYAAGYTDERSLIDPALGWATLVARHGVSMIQTDNPAALNAWRDGRRDTVPAGTVRVQAEDYSFDGRDVGYHDLEDDNKGGTVARPYEGVDLCDQAGAIVMCWIRAGEWVKYTVDVQRAGTYEVRARVSSPYDPAGRVSLAWDGGAAGAPVDIAGTTSHNAFTTQVLEPSRRLSPGTHTFILHTDPDAYQNFNIDYFELTRLR